MRLGNQVLEKRPGSQGEPTQTRDGASQALPRKSHGFAAEITEIACLSVF